MTYTIDRDDQALSVRVHGHLDINSSPVLEEALKGQLDGVTSLTVDLADVDYVSSMGLRLLLALQKRMFKQGSMQIVNVNEPVMQLFDDSGFSEIIDIR